MGQRNYVFTLNNPDYFDPEDFPETGSGPLLPDLELLTDLRYASYQLETGAEGTLHFQGYLEFHRPQRLAAVKRGQFVYAHFEVRRGTRIQARDYTQKPEGQCCGPWTHGTWIGGQGARTDLNDAATDLLGSRDLRQFALQHPGMYVKHHAGFAKLLETTRPLPEQPEPVWRPWQLDALAIVDGLPDPRKVHWFVDYEGGKGKSFLVRYLATNRGALPLSSARHDRLLQAFNGERVVTFDFSRDVSSAGAGGGSDAHDRTPYAVIESIKNGVVFSGFYGGGPRIYGIPHVLCFSNFDPDQTKLSADRWDIRILGAELE